MVRGSGAHVGAGSAGGHVQGQPQVSACLLWCADHDVCNFQLRVANRRGEKSLPFHSLGGVGRESQRNSCECTDPKLHTYCSLQAEDCFAYFLLGRKYSDFSEEMDAASCSCLGCPGEESKERKNKKIKRFQGRGVVRRKKSLQRL